MQKPNIQELARWSIKNVVNASQDLVIQAKLARQQQLLQQIRQQQMWQKQLNNSAPPSLGYNLQQQQQQQNQQKQELKLPSIDDILAEEKERRILSDLESLKL